MLNRWIWTSLAFGLLVVSGLTYADQKLPTKLASGKVKQVSAESLTIQQGAAELSFAVTKDTKVVAKGASTKQREAQKEGKSVTFTDLIQAEQRVLVRYQESGGKLEAIEVRVTP